MAATQPVLPTLDFVDEADQRKDELELEDSEPSEPTESRSTNFQRLLRNRASSLKKEDSNCTLKGSSDSPRKGSAHHVKLAGCETILPNTPAETNDADEADEDDLLFPLTLDQEKETLPSQSSSAGRRRSRHLTLSQYNMSRGVASVRLQSHGLSSAQLGADLSGSKSRSSSSSEEVSKATVEYNAFLAKSQAIEEFFKESHEVGPAPEPRVHRELNKLELQRRDATVEAVARISSQYTQEVEEKKKQMRTRGRRKLATSPAAFLQRSTSEALAELANAACELDTDSDHVQPVIVFDWDDTLFPTWYITEFVQKDLGKDGAVSEDTPYWDVLAAHGLVMRETLEEASRRGKAFIVTLARRPWVLDSAAKYVPGIDMETLFSKLGIEIFYARECLRKPEIALAQLEEGLDMFALAKRNAMQRCLHKSYKKGTKMHLLSIGDSPAERQAAHEVLWCAFQENESFCKTVKLMADPSLSNLSGELRLLLSWFGKMVSYKDDFDFSMETPEDLDKMTDTFGLDGMST